MLPVKYVPKHEVVTFSGDSYYIDSEKKEAFIQEMEKNKFVRVGDAFVAVSSIEKIRPAKSEISVLESLISNESEEIKAKVRKKVSEREKEGFDNSEGVIRNIIEAFKN